MKEELHLFIIWENARYKQEEIIKDIKAKFQIIKIYEIEWNKENFSKNLSRFYGANLPKGCGKEEHCGNGKFLLIIVKDTNPKYEERMTSKGPKILNINMFDKKEQYRELTGGGHRVHATNNEIETNHDLTLLLGKNIKDYLKENNTEWNGDIEEKNIDLIGTSEWKTVTEMFYALNNCIKYAILRNYESLPNEIYDNDHNDIDIICESLEDAAYVLNATPVFEEEYRVHYKTNVEGRIAYFDLRHIGDNYYSKEIEEKILNNRIYNEKGFYTLEKEDYFYTLLYHALIQKNEFKQDYKEKLTQMKLENVNENTTIEEYSEILKKWLWKSNYLITNPMDKSVIMNMETLKYFEPVLYRKGPETIDILMATYNGEKYLKEQIESILNQTYSNIRLIISDDCSTDKTIEIIKEYEEKDKRITLYSQEKNLGFVKNFEFLLTKVENRIYMLSDQDDIWLPEKVEATYNYLKESNADLVFADLTVVDDDENIINKSFNQLMNLTRKIEKTINSYELTYLYNCVTGCTIMTKKEKIGEILPIPAKSKHMYHDHWIALITSIKGNVAYLPKQLIKYRQHGKNQIGVKHMVSKLKTVGEIREHFIDVKLGIFGTYIENEDKFPKEIKIQNKEAYNYYEMLRNKKNINFRKWRIFHKLYKNETFKYYIENFLILNMPCIAKVLFKIKNMRKKGE